MSNDKQVAVDVEDEDGTQRKLVPISPEDEAMKKAAEEDEAGADSP